MVAHTYWRKMMRYRVEIPMKLPSLNTYINVCRTNPYKAAKFKKDLEEEISIYLRPLPKIEKPVKILFTWIEENRRRDCDNICAAKKFILDALVKAGRLQNDNRKCVTAFTDEFDYGVEAKVILVIEEEEKE